MEHYIDYFNRTVRVSIFIRISIAGLTIGNPVLFLDNESWTKSHKISIETFMTAGESLCLIKKIPSQKNKGFHKN